MKTFAFLVSLLANTIAITLDDAYQRCEGVTREELEPCIVQLINDLRPLIQQGIPELGLENDTCAYHDLNLNYNQGINFLTVNYHDGRIRGMEDFEMKHLKIDYEKKVAVWSVYLPVFINLGRYYMDAKVLAFPIYGNGTFWNRLEDFHFYGVSKLEVVDIDGEPHLQEKDTEITFSYKKASMRMNNLYGGDAVLQEAASAFLNMNVDALLDEMRPSAKMTFRTITGQHINAALSKIKLEDLAGSEFIKKAFDIK